MHKKYLYLLPLLLIGVVIAAAQTSPAHADAAWTFIVDHNSKCMDVEGASMANRELVQVYGCHGGDNQRYTIRGNPSGWVEIIAVHSGKCLDVRSASMRAGRNIQQDVCHGGDNQLWRFVPQSNGQFVIENRNSELCIAAARTSDWPSQRDRLEQRSCVVFDQDDHNRLWTRVLADCGDGQCRFSDGEDILSCPQDCGLGGGGSSPPPSCGDGLCAGGETCSSCSMDCGFCQTCGDGLCQPGESNCTCPLDCPIPDLSNPSRDCFIDFQ
ncbi:MAG: RICIN domain-containing protein [Acidobacteriota bacterium]